MTREAGRNGPAPEPRPDAQDYRRTVMTKCICGPQPTMPCPACFPRLAWTTEPPSVQGLYLSAYQDHRGEPVICCRYDKERIADCVSRGGFRGLQFLGPLPEVPR